jgi:hypothetical protein
VTQIIYTITLQNADGTRVSASTLALDYPETSSAMLHASLKKNVEDLARSHAALMTMLEKAMANRVAQTPSAVNGHSKTKAAAAGQR